MTTRRAHCYSCRLPPKSMPTADACAKRKASRSASDAGAVSRRNATVAVVAKLKQTPRHP
eukprot:6207025-Pyramimonas_sp.AAC.2